MSEEKHELRASFSDEDYEAWKKGDLVVNNGIRNYFRYVVSR